MALSTMLTLFTTLAQVSFTVSGLMAVAIAGDSKRRDYWFGHEARSLFIYISFLILLLPGFISVGGLIPSTNKIPSWVFVAFFFGLLYLTLAINIYFKKRKLAEPEEFKRLEKRFSKVNSELGFFGLAMIFSSIYGGFEAYVSSATEYSKAETWLGIMLFFAIISGALASVILLRANELPDKPSNLTSTTFMPDKDLGVTNQEAKSGFSVLIYLLIAITAFLIGVFVKSKDN